MTSAVAALKERRDETRVSGHTLGWMQAPKAIFSSEGTVDLQEVSATGLKILSDVQLHPDEELVIHLEKEALPIRATVIWVRENRPTLFRSRKSWTAGCRLAPESMARVRLEPELAGGRGVTGRRVLWMIAALLGTAATIAYLLLKVASLIGDAGGNP